MLRKKIVLVSYYSYPCRDALVREVFEYELAKMTEVALIFLGGVNRDLDVPNNILVPRAFVAKIPFIRSAWAYSKIRSLFHSNKNTVFIIRDMPFLSFLCRLIPGATVGMQVTAPLGDMNLFLSRHSKRLTSILRYIRGISFNFFLDRVKNRVDIFFPITSAYAEQINIRGPIIAPVSMGASQELINEGMSSDLSFEKRIIYFGSLSKLRNPKFIVDLFCVLSERHSEWSFEIAGSFESVEESDYFDSLIAGANLSGGRVKYIGNMSREALTRILKKSFLSVCAIPDFSHFKISSPTKMYESLALGVPVVANYGIAEHERVANLSGSVVLADYDVKSFCETISELIMMPHDRDRLANIGRNWVRSNASYHLAAKVIYSSVEV